MKKKFNKLIQGLTRKVDFERFPNLIFFFKGDECWLEYDLENGYLWCRYDGFWKVLENEEHDNYLEVQAFIKKQVEKHFKLRSVTPSSTFMINLVKVEKHFKLRSVTPIADKRFFPAMVEKHFKLRDVIPNRM